jgi:hemin uptake protein HemP
MLSTAMADALEPSPPPDEPAQPAGKPRELPREAWLSEELLGERTEVQILHNGEVYRLRRTRQGKLILYK